MSKSVEIINKIYSYSTETYSLKGWFKVGETSRLTGQRIKEQDGTSNPEPLIQVSLLDEEYNTNLKSLDKSLFWEVESVLSDDEIRETLIQDHGYDPVRTDTDREWLVKVRTQKELDKLRSENSDIELRTFFKDELLQDIYRVIRDSDRDTRDDYKPYFYKTYIQTLFFAKLDIDMREYSNTFVDFVLELAPRFGKTTWMITVLIKLFLEYNIKVAVLPSYWLSTHSSFEKDLLKWKGFSDHIHYVSRNDDLGVEMEKYYGKKLIVCELSLHMSDEQFEKKFSKINELEPSEKVTMIDEADFGAWNQIEMIEKLRCKTNIYLSGSGVEKIMTHLKNVRDNIIRWTYTDMLLMKSGQHPLFFKK